MGTTYACAATAHVKDNIAYLLLVELLHKLIQLLDVLVLACVGAAQNATDSCITVTP